MNFSAERHEQLIKKEWNIEEVQSVIEKIFNNTISSFDEKNFWKCAEQTEVPFKSVYFGAAGVLWSLLEISAYLKNEISFDTKKAIENIYTSYLDKPDTGEVAPSLFLGEVGILLVKYRITPTNEIEDKIYDLIQSNIENPILEILWAAPGTMLGASYFYKKTKNKRWADLFRANVDFLLRRLKEQELIWEQNLYGKKVHLVGAGHGYFGNVYGILKVVELLDLKDKEYILSHVERVITELSIVEDNTANWAIHYPKKEDAAPLVQWCHGAAGVVTSLKNYPPNPLVDDLLIKAGELVWKAGPLKKGVGVCHGTDGNGYVFLQLYKRTGNKEWLERARAFAMHALKQTTGSNSLFTGDLGFALFLIACIEEQDDFPFLDDL